MKKLIYIIALLPFLAFGQSSPIDPEAVYTDLIESLTADADLPISGNGTGVPSITDGLKLNYATASTLAYLNSSKVFTSLANGTGLQVLRMNSGATGFEWATLSVGDVTKVGTPVDNQIGVWTGDGTIEGDANLTYNGIRALITIRDDEADIGLQVGNSDGSLQMGNGTSTDNLFVPYILGSSKGSTAPTLLIGNGAAGDDAGVTPLFRISGRVNNGTVSNRPLMSIANVNTDVLSISASGVITLATWNGTAVGAVYGGTGQTTVTTGDLLYGSAANTWSKLAKGTNGHYLRLNAGTGVPEWGAIPSPSVPTLDQVMEVGATASIAGAISITSTGSAIEFITGSATDNITLQGNTRFAYGGIIRSELATRAEFTALGGNASTASTSPYFQGIAEGASGQAFVIQARNGTDGATSIPGMQFSVLNNDPIGVVANRPLFGWYNYQTLLLDVSSANVWNYQAGSISNVTLTAPKFASDGHLDDVNGNEWLEAPTTVASATNHFKITNAINGASPTLSAVGSSDANISPTISGKGSGNLKSTAGSAGVGLTLDASTTNCEILFNSTSNNWALGVESGGGSDLFGLYSYGGTAQVMLFSSAGVLKLPTYANGSLSITGGDGTVTSSSDSTLKVSDGEIADGALEKVLQLKPRYYFWNEKSGYNKEQRQLGLYAQEVHEVLGEEAANVPADGKTWGYYDRAVIAFLIKAMQEQQEQIEALTSEVSLLKSKK